MSSPPTDKPNLFHLKWVAKIALLMAAVAAVGLLLVVFLATDDKGASYVSIISSHSLTQQNLVPAMGVFALLTVVVAAVFTWLIALYASFRIAGPLFRFAQNLKVIIKDSFAVPMAIRQTDMLQREWHEFETGQARLRMHYRELREALDKYRTALSQDKSDQAAAALADLQEVERRVQL